MKKYIYVVLGSLICAIAFNLFLVPYNILPGGVSGIALVVNKFIPINKALFIFVLSMLLLIVSYFLLGRENTLRSLLGSLLFPLFVSITERLLLIFPIDIDSVFLSVIFGGILFGFGLGLVYREGFTTGGSNIINQIISKYFHISMGTGLFITEGLIVLLGGLAFGLNTMMYSIITIYLSSIIIDKVIIGISSNKSFYIITSKMDEVNEYIINELKHGVTIIDGQGFYSKKNVAILLTVIPTSDYYKLKSFLAKVDENAFFVVSDSYEVRGGE